VFGSIVVCVAIALVLDWGRARRRGAGVARRSPSPAEVAKSRKLNRDILRAFGHLMLLGGGMLLLGILWVALMWFAFLRGP
jgi:hypothetical protein